LRTARLTTEQSALQYQVVVADRLLDVRTAYHGVLLAEQQIIVQEASVKLLSEQLETTNRRFEAGAVPRFDVLRGEVELANARPRLIRAKNAHRVAKNNLATLLAYNIPVTVREDIPLTLTGKLEPEPYRIELPAAVAQALARRPELGVFRKTAALRKERITVAKSIYKPIISLFAGYGARNSSFRNDFFSRVAGPMAGVELNWDIYDGGLTKGKVIEAEALHEKAQEDLDDGGRRIEQEVRTAYSSFLEAREVLESQKKVQEQAEEALRLATARYEAGTSAQLDVLNAQTALTEARTTQVQAAHDYIVARARLERAMGEDAWPAPPKPGTK
jgi:outer membrane protein TolC